MHVLVQFKRSVQHLQHATDSTTITPAHPNQENVQTLAGVIYTLPHSAEREFKCIALCTS